MKELWKNIPNFKGYQASNLGRIKGKMNRVMTPHPDGNGYLRTGFRKNGKSFTIKVHQMIALTWVKGKTKERCEINHHNAKKHDNRVTNLKWVTRQENLEHARKHKLWVAHYGSENGNSKLKECDIYIIRDMVTQGFSSAAISKMYCVCHTTIKKIRHKTIWGWLK